MILTPPLSNETVKKLRVGDRVKITGYIYTARDAAHKRLVDAIKKNEPLPVELNGEIIYYVGPTPSRPNRVIGSAGPTTSIRMDLFLEPLLSRGLKATIGKGYRSTEAIECMKRYNAVYLVAVGGIGALLSKKIKSSEVIAYEDLGTEAIRKLYVEDFPVVVGNDCEGNDIFREGIKKFALIMKDVPLEFGE